MLYALGGRREKWETDQRVCTPIYRLAAKEKSLCTRDLILSRELISSDTDHHPIWW